MWPMCTVLYTNYDTYLSWMSLISKEEYLLLDIVSATQTVGRQITLWLTLLECVRMESIRVLQTSREIVDTEKKGRENC